MQEFRRTFLESQVTSFTAVARVEEENRARSFDDAQGERPAFVIESLAYWQAQLDRQLDRPLG